MDSLIRNFSELATSAGRKAGLSILEAGLLAIQPEPVVNSQLAIRNLKLVIGEAEFDLKEFKRVFLLGFGKGSAEISRVIGEKLGDYLTVGWVIDAQVGKKDGGKIEYTVGTHPLPSQINVGFTRKVLASLSGLTEQDLVLVVVCGGGSAMLTDPTVPLPTLIAMNERLLKSGATIAEMNAERKKIDRVKGGGLAKQLLPGRVVGLIFSDVPGNDIAVVASGPTAAESAKNILMLSNQTALEAMKKKAEELGYAVEIYTDRIQGEAREIGRQLISKLVNPSLGKKVILAGGETTVRAPGRGEGGRNQEVVLGALPFLKSLVILAADSDGWDNGPFAGAIGDSLTVEKSKGLGLDQEKFLNDNNSYTFFKKVGDGVETGRLPSNVADLMVVLRP